MIGLKGLRVVLHGGRHLIGTLVYAKTSLYHAKSLLVVFLRQIQAAFETTSTEQCAQHTHPQNFHTLLPIILIARWRRLPVNEHCFHGKLVARWAILTKSTVRHHEHE